MHKTRDSAMVFVSNEKVIVADEFWGKDYSPPSRILNEFQKIFKQEPTENKFRELVQSIKPEIKFWETDSDYDVGNISVDVLWIFNGAGEDVRLKSKNPYRNNDVIFRNSIFARVG